MSDFEVPDLELAVAEGSIDTVIVGFTDLYGRLLGKRLDAEFFASNPHGTHACDYLLTVDMEMGPAEGYEFSNWGGGYGDMHLVADLSTLRVVPWLERTALVLCDVERATSSGHLDAVEVAPRRMLKRQIERLAELGLQANAASELEYYLYRTSYRDASDQGYRDLVPAGWYIEDYHLLQGARTEDLNGAFRRNLRDFGVPVESTKGEFGHGQHELNIRYCDVLEMADRHVLMKQCIKEVSDQMGASATFMAKHDEAQAGSSSHLHLSLWAGDEPAFPGENHLAGLRVSGAFEGFLAGWMEWASDLMPCFAPTVNSYKRFQAGSWAPTGIAWSPDNRTAGFRVVGSGASLRIECRLPGADVNPYLAYAAALAAGIDGIVRGLPAPPPFLGDGYIDASLPTIPASLDEAAAGFAASQFAREAFGDEVVDHYAHFWHTEAAAYRRAVTDWERRRYFERI